MQLRLKGAPVRLASEVPEFFLLVIKYILIVFFKLTAHSVLETPLGAGVSQLTYSTKLATFVKMTTPSNNPVLHIPNLNF